MIRSISISYSFLIVWWYTRWLFIVIFSCPPFLFLHHCVYLKESLPFSLFTFLSLSLSLSLSLYLSIFPPYCVSMDVFVLVTLKRDTFYTILYKESWNKNFVKRKGMIFPLRYLKIKNSLIPCLYWSLVYLICV